ncbi:ABC transporter permease [Opitutales bacterium]|nr:ABC transporter permease [Opitutales bacterium]
MTYLEGQKLFWKELFGQADLSRRIFLHNFLDVHRQNRLGLLWVVINPCIPLIVYNSMQFLGIFKDTSADIPRSVHLTLGLLIYYAFSDALNSFAVCLPQNSQYILRGGVSKLSVYAGTFYEVVSNFMIMFVAFILLSYSVGYQVGLTVFCIPLVGLIAIVLGTVLGVFLSIFYVYYRDLGNMLRMFTFYLLFGSGVFGEIEETGAFFDVLRSSPLYKLISQGRTMLFEGQFTFDSSILLVFGMSLGLFILFMGFFMRGEKRLNAFI